MPEAKVAFLIKNPQDPMTYMNDGVMYPSFWAWKEWEDFAKAYGLAVVLGKPTTVGTSLGGVISLQEVEYGPSAGAAGATEGVQGLVRVAPGFKGAVLVLDSLKWWLDHGGEPAEFAVRMTKEQWREHLRNDHHPYRNECRRLLEAAGKGRMHRRITHPLSVDLGAPYQAGKDHTSTRPRYVVGGSTWREIPSDEGRGGAGGAIRGDEQKAPLAAAGQGLEGE